MKQKERKEKSKAKILEAALKLFANEGYANCSTTKIAKEAGVSYGLLYYHFKNKGEILESALSSGLENLKRGFEDLKLSGNPDADLGKFLDRYLDSFNNEREFWLVYSGITFDPKISIESLKVAENEYRKLQNQHLINIFEQTSASHPIAEAFFLDACLYGMTMHACMMKDDAILQYGIGMLKRKYGNS